VDSNQASATLANSWVAAQVCRRIPASRAANSEVCG
jgi:hypothetical protein